MPIVPADPSAQKNLRLSIGTDEYQMHVSSVQWTPAQQSVEWRGGTPDAVFTSTTSSTWTANFTLVQDWENPESFFNFLLENEGEEVAIAYKPVADGEFEITATVTLVAPAIGGPVNQFNESTVQMGSTKPVKTVTP